MSSLFQVAFDEDSLADQLCAELLQQPAAASEVVGRASDAAAAVAAMLCGCGSAVSAAAALEALFPRASGITLRCPAAGCGGELSLQLSGQSSSQPCSCSVPTLASLASGGRCECKLAGVQQPTATEQRQLAAFVAVLGRQLCQLIKEQQEVRSCWSWRCCCCCCSSLLASCGAAGQDTLLLLHPC